MRIGAPARAENPAQAQHVRRHARRDGKISGEIPPFCWCLQQNVPKIKTVVPKTSVLHCPSVRDVRTAMQAHRKQSRKRGTGLMPSRVVNERHAQAMDAGNATGRMIGRIAAIIMATLVTLATVFAHSAPPPQPHSLPAAVMLITLPGAPLPKTSTSSLPKAKATTVPATLIRPPPTSRTHVG